MQATYVVGVTGGSGSGKTSFVRELREHLHDVATLFTQDDYYIGLEGIEVDPDGVHNFDLPSSIDSAAMAADIGRVMHGETIVRKEYTFQTIYADNADAPGSTGRVGAERQLGPAPILIIEGLFCMHEPALRQLMNLSVYIDASDVAKLTRRIRRDRLERHLPLEDVLYRYERHVLPAYRRYIAPYRTEADLVVNNEMTYAQALEVLVAHLRNRAEIDHRDITAAHTHALKIRGN